MLCCYLGTCCDLGTCGQDSCICQTGITLSWHRKMLGSIFSALQTRHEQSPNLRGSIEDQSPPALKGQMQYDQLPQAPLTTHFPLCWAVHSDCGPQYTLRSFSCFPLVLVTVKRKTEKTGREVKLSQMKISP